MRRSDRDSGCIDTGDTSQALQLAQQASAERSVVTPWMYAVVLMAVFLLLGYVENLVVPYRPA